MTRGNTFDCSLNGTGVAVGTGSSTDHSISTTIVTDTGIKVMMIIT